MKSNKLDSALRITLIYALVSAIWIVASDEILGYLAPGAIWLQSSKGLLYVTAVSAILYGLLRADQRSHARTERELRDSREQLRAIIEASPAGIAATDPDGKVVLWNHAAEVIYGWRADEVLGQQLEARIVRNAEEVQSIRKSILAGASVVQVESERERKDGQTVYVSIQATALRDAAGWPSGIFAIVTDITRHKRLEQDLLLTQFSVDHASIGIMRTGAEAQILSVNEHYCRLTGYTAEELLGLHVYDVDPAFPFSRWKKHRTKLRETGSDIFVTAHRRKDGTTFPVEVSATYVSFQGQEFSVSFIRDITERLRAEEEIRSLARFPDENPDPVMRISQDGTLLYANSAAQDTLSGWHLSPGRPGPEMLRGIASIEPDSRDAGEIEIAYDGQLFSFHISPVSEMGYANLYGRNITRRRQAEARLRDSEAKFAATFQSSSNGIAIAGPNRMIVEINPAYLEMLGYSRQEVIGRSLYDFHIIDENDINVFRELLNRDGRVHQMEIKLRMKDGGTRAVMASINPVDISGEPHWLTTITDITGRKQAEEQIRQQSAELSAALRQKEEAYALLNTLMDTAPIGMAFIDRNLRYQRINATLAEVNGIPAADHIGHTVGELLPDIASAVEPLFRQVIETRKPVINLEVSGETPRSPGEQRHWLASYYPVVGPDDTVLGLGLNVLEITERKRTEEALRASEERFRTLFENLTEGVAFHELAYDKKGRPVNYRIIDANPAFQTHTGINLKDAIGDLATKVYGTDAPPYLDIFGAVAQTGRPARLETYFAPLDRSFRMSVCPTGEGRFATLFEDITERKRADEALRQSREQLNVFIENAPVAIAMLDRDMHYLSVSRRWLADYSLGEADVIGRSHYEIFPEIPDRWKKIHRRAMRGEILQADEDLFERLNGSVQWLRWVVKPWYVRPDEVGGIIILSEDISDRKAAEQARVESQQQFRTLVDISPLALFINRGGKIDFVNPALVELVGASSPEEMQGRSPLDLFIREHHGAIRKRIKRVLGERISFSHVPEKLVRLDGAIRDVEVTASYVTIQGDPAVQVTLTDVTERNLAERNLRRLNRVYSVLSSINEAIVRIREPEQLFDHACRIAVETGGFKMAWIGLRDQHTGAIYAAAHNAAAADVIDQIVAVANSPEAANLPMMSGIRRGEVAVINHVAHDVNVEAHRGDLLGHGYQSFAGLPIQIGGTVRGLFALYAAEPNFFDEEEIRLLAELAQDISFAMEVAEIEAQRTQAERQVRESQARLQSTLDNMMEGCQIIDHDWRYYYINDMAAAHGRLEKSKLLGHTIMDVYPGIDQTEMFRALRKCMATRLPERLVNQFVYPDGDSRWFELSIQPAPEGVFILSTDITDRKLAEDELQRLNAQLEQRVVERTAQLEARTHELESFSYSVSHDLKAPLRGIDGYSQLLVTEYAGRLDDEGRQFIANIRRGAQQMNQLIEDLLAYSRLERRALDQGSVNPASLVNALLAERTDQLRNCKVTVDIPFTDVPADPDGLLMALRNLVDNAIKFTRDTLSPVIDVGGREEAQSYVIWVRDNGIGFDMKFHDRIFTIFQRLHRVEDYPGTGVGLAIVLKAMNRMGGRAWAESQPGHGATFYLELPRTPQS